MTTVEIQEWSFTRQSVEDLPFDKPPSEDEVNIVYDSAQNCVEIRGIMIDGDTNHDILPSKIDYQHGLLQIGVKVSTLDRQFAVDIGQIIPYEVIVRFRERLPRETKVQHIDESENIQFEKSKKRSDV